MVAAGGLWGAAVPVEPENLEDRFENQEGLRDSEGLPLGEGDVPVLSELPRVKPGFGGMALGCVAVVPLALDASAAAPLSSSWEVRTGLPGAGRSRGDVVSEEAGKVGRRTCGERSGRAEQSC